MPRHIVKPERDVDFYVEWSTVVDAPTFVGTLDELIEYGKTESWSAEAHERIARADACSSSARWYDPSWETDEAYLLENAGTFPRSRMREVVAAYLAGGVDACLAQGLVDTDSGDADRPHVGDELFEEGH